MMMRLFLLLQSSSSSSSSSPVFCPSFSKTKDDSQKRSQNRVEFRVWFGFFFSFFGNGRTSSFSLSCEKKKATLPTEQKNTNFFFPLHDGQVRPRVQRRDEIVQSARHGFESAFQEHARDGDEHQREKFERCARYALRFFFFCLLARKTRGGGKNGRE